VPVRVEKRPDALRELRHRTLNVLPRCHAATIASGTGAREGARHPRADTNGRPQKHGVEPLSARRPHIDAWARSLEELNLKPRTVARRLSSVSSWYDFLVTEQVCAASPAKDVRRPKIADRGETPGLTRDELRRLMAAAREYGSLRSIALLFAGAPRCACW
jgi:integrase